MSETIEAPVAAEASPEGSQAPDPVADAVAAERKRQAGIEAGRLEAIRERDEAKRELEALRAGKKPDPANETFDVEAYKRELKAETEKAIADAKLDARFPRAREIAPGQTDTAQLARLEAMLSEPEAPETPKPVGNNQQKTPGTKSIEDMTLEELKANMKTFSRDDMGLPPLA